jgi:hypothetical protein
MKAVAITAEGAFIPASACALIRRVLMADLGKCRRDCIPVAPEIVEAVQTIDNIGAAFEARRASKVSDVSPDVSPLESPRFAPVDWDSMTVSAAAEALRISPQATRRLLERGTLHGERGPRAWRVCAESVAARKDNRPCQH